MQNVTCHRHSSPTAEYGAEGAASWARVSLWDLLWPRCGHWPGIWLTSRGAHPTIVHCELYPVCDPRAALGSALGTGSSAWWNMLPELSRHWHGELRLAQQPPFRCPAPCAPVLHLRGACGEISSAVGPQPPLLSWPVTWGCWGVCVYKKPPHGPPTCTAIDCLVDTSLPTMLT